MTPFYKNLALWLVISLMVILLFNMFNHPTQTKQQTSYSDFLNAVAQGEVSQVTMQGNNILGRRQRASSSSASPLTTSFRGKAWWRATAVTTSISRAGAWTTAPATRTA